MFKHVHTVHKHRNDRKRHRVYHLYRNTPPDSPSIRIHFLEDDPEGFEPRRVVPTDTNSREFAKAYEHTESLAATMWAEHGGKSLSNARAETPGTFRALVRAYQGSAEWKAKKPATQRSYRPHINWINDAWGDHRVVKIRRGDILFRRDALADTPRIADLFVAVMSLLLTFARDRGFREDHPGQRVPKINHAAPYEPWSDEELADFLKRTTPECRLAAMALLFTGQRQSDIVNTPGLFNAGQIFLYARMWSRLRAPFHRA